MKKLCVLVVSLFLSSVNFSAQTPTPPPPEKEDAEVVKISTALIQVDVTVTDGKGKIVTDLTPEDFEIYENKEKQKITNFSFVSAEAQPKSTTKIESKTQSDIFIPPVPIKPAEVRRTIALVVDDLGLSADSVYSVRRSLKKFVDEQMQLNDLVAIIRTSGGIGITQQFTSDKRLLSAAIENIKWNSSGRTDANPFFSDEILAAEEAKLAGLEATDADIDSERQSIKNAADFKLDVFYGGTLGALNYIVKGMSVLPGRKSIMFFSDGFRISPTEEPGKEPPPNQKARDAEKSFQLLESLKKLTELANRSSIIIYSFDPRGLVNIGAYPASSKIVRNRLYNNQEGLTFLAKETGGKTFFNSNDLNQGLEEMLEDQKGFYLLGYQPDTESFNPQTHRFNKLEVRLKRPDLKVRYRSGFFGVSNEEPTVAKKTPTQEMAAVIASPFAVNSIPLNLNTVFGSNATDRLFIRSFLHIDAKEIKFSDQPDGWKQAVFDILAISFERNENPVESFNKTYTLRVKEDTYQKILKEGFGYSFLLPVQKPGPYQLRVAIRDSATARIGSANAFIQVPDLQNNRLALSGIILENFTEPEWQKMKGATQPDSNTNVVIDTSLRQFKKGTILRYSADVYNAGPATAELPNVQTQMRIFRDGKVILEGKLNQLQMKQASNSSVVSGGLFLGDEMTVGNYVLHLLVIDKTNPEKPRVTSNWVQFELVQ